MGLLGRIDLSVVFFGGEEGIMSETVGVDKSLLAFLNGLSKRLYFGEQNITDEFLRDEVLQVPDEGK